MKVLVLCLALVLLTACPGSGSKSPTEEEVTEASSPESATTVSGEGSISITTKADEAATLEIRGATLHIPKGALGEMDVRMDNESPADLGDRRETPLLANMVTLKFSRVQMAQGDDAMTLGLKLPAGPFNQAIEEGNGIYFLYKVKGGIASEDAPESPEWSPLLGDYNSTTSTLSARLSATADEISFMPVAGKGLLIYVGGPTAENETALHKMIRLLNIPTAHAGPFDDIGTKDVIENWQDWNWAVVCDLASFGYPLNVENCPTVPDHALWEHLNPSRFKERAAWLAGHGYNKAIIQYISADTLDKEHLKFPDAVEIDLDEPRDKYLLAYYQNEVRNKGPAWYERASGRLIITSAWEFGLDNRDDALVHEMFHAVQAALIPNVGNFSRAEKDKRPLWITEAHAVAIGFWYQFWYKFPDDQTIRLLTVRRQDVWRDWSLPLRENSPLIMPYWSFEFWALIDDGDLNYIKQLYSLIGNQWVELANSYRIINEELSRVLILGEPEERSLPALYKNKLAKRRWDGSGYPKYYNVEREKDPALDDRIGEWPDGAEIGEEGGVSVIMKGEINPMSMVARKLEMEYVNSYDSDIVTDESCHQFTLLPNDKDPHQSLLIKFRFYGPGQTVLVKGKAVSFQVVDTDIDTTKDKYSDPREWQLKVERVGDEDCEKEEEEGGAPEGWPASDCYPKSIFCTSNTEDPGDWWCILKITDPLSDPPCSASLVRCTFGGCIQNIGIPSMDIHKGDSIACPAVSPQNPGCCTIDESERRDVSPNFVCPGIPIEKWCRLIILCAKY